MSREKVGCQIGACTTTPKHLSLSQSLPRKRRCRSHWMDRRRNQIKRPPSLLEHLNRTLRVRKERAEYRHVQQVRKLKPPFSDARTARYAIRGKTAALSIGERGGMKSLHGQAHLNQSTGRILNT